MNDVTLFINNGGLNFNNSTMVVSNSNLIMNDNKLIIDKGELSLVNLSVASIPILNIHNSITVESGAYSEFKGDVVFAGSDNKTIIDHVIDLNGVVTARKDVLVLDTTMTLSNTMLNVNTGDIVIVNGNVDITDGGISISNGNVSLNSNSIRIDEGDIGIHTGGIEIDKGQVVIGTNIFSDNGIVLDSSSIDIMYGYLNVDSVFVVDSNQVTATVPVAITGQNLTITDGILVLDNTDIEISGAGDIFAPNSSSIFKECTLTNLYGYNVYVDSVYGKNTLSCNVVSSNLDVTNSFTIGNTVAMTKTNVTFNVPVIINSGMNITGDQIIKGGLDVKNTLTASNIDTFQVDTFSLNVKGGSQFKHSALFESNISVLGKTLFKGIVDFRNPLYLNTVVNFYDKIQCYSNVTFFSPCIFNSVAQFKSLCVFDDNIKANSNLDVPIAGVSFNEGGMVVLKKATINSCDIQTFKNNNMECTNSAVFTGKTYFNDASIFTSNATFTQSVNFRQPLYLSSLYIASNMTCTDSMTLFKKKVYVDDTLISSNITIQNQGYIKNLSTDSLQVFNFSFTGDLFDIRKNLLVRNNALINSCTVEKDLLVRGSIVVQKDSEFKKGITAHDHVITETVTTSNINVQYLANFEGEVNVNNISYFNDTMYVVKEVTFYKEMTINNGFNVKNGQVVYSDSTIITTLGKAVMENVSIQNLQTYNVAKMQNLHVNKSVSVNEDITVDGTIYAFNAHVTNDIMALNNLTCVKTIKCKDLETINKITTSMLQSSTLFVYGLFSAAYNLVECMVPLKTGTIDAYNVCTFHDKVNIISLNVSEKSIFKNGADFQGTVVFYDDTQFLKNTLFKSNVTVRNHLYVEGSLYLSEDINLQRDITVANLKANNNVYVENLMSAEKAFVKDTLTVAGLSYLPKIGIGPTNASIMANNALNLNIQCSNLKVTGEAIFNKLVTIGDISNTLTILKVNGNIEATKIVQLSDQRTKFRISNVSDETVYTSLNAVHMKYFNKIVDDTPAIGFMAQDFDNDPLLKTILIRDGEDKSITLMEHRYCRNISVDNNIIVISDGGPWFLATDQIIVLNDGRQYKIIECNKEVMQATIDPPLDITDDSITIIGLQVNDLVKIDQSQLLSLTMGMCSSLFRRIQALEKKLQDAMAS